MASTKQTELEGLIAKLLNEKLEINLQDIVHETGLLFNPPDRRTIQRALTRLIERDVIQAKGNARARVYVLNERNKQLDFHQSDLEAFTDIPLSDASVKLLAYVSKSIPSRKPTGYNQDFLKSYDPEKTPYLSRALREELLMVGRVEIVERLGGTYARNILNRLLIDLSWNSSRLEGNTYSLLETKRLIEFGENVEGKDLADAQMILNHKDAIEYIVESAQETIITSHEVRSIHALLSENLLGDPSASGRIRELAVGISGTTYLPLENPHVLKEYFELFIKKLNGITDPFEQSFFALVHLSYMQAFEDVNKRTARLVANIPMIKQNLNPLSFIDVNQTDYVLALLGVYEKNEVSLLRDLYIWAYKRSAQRYSAMQQAMGEPDVFKMKHRDEIKAIVRTIILKKVAGSEVVSTIKRLLAALRLEEHDSLQLFQIIETEIMHLHDGNIARYKIKPSEFVEWRAVQ